MAKTESQPFLARLSPAIKASILGVLIFLVIFSATISFFHIAHSNRIFPGVHISGYPVGGLTIEQAAVELAQHFNSPQENAINLFYLDERIQLHSSQIGVSLDAVRSAFSAFQFGRSLPLGRWISHQPFIFSRHIEAPPVYVLDQNTTAQALQEIANRMDQDVLEAVLFLQGTQVSAKAGQTGHKLDISSSLNQIEMAMQDGILREVHLVVREEHPVLMDASPFIADAQAVLNDAFIIEAPAGFSASPAKWTITPENLAPMLTFKSTADSPQALKPHFTKDTLRGLLNSIADQVNRNPENPRFIFNDETYELDLYQEGIPGISIDMAESEGAIQAAIAGGKNTAQLVLERRDPEVSDDATGGELGITELVHVESSYFYGSDKARVQNIQTAANEFLGVLIKPGETFSMASKMRDITLDNGYSEALIIYDGKTIEGVGGGVCQVSTTLFRTAFFGGYPIVERYPHAYRVSYYEKVTGNYRDSDLAGLDATVYIPLVDFKFTNDTPHWLLMEAYVYPAASQIMWKFYSTEVGRTIEWSTTGLTNKVEPKKPLYSLNEDLEPGEIKQVDWEAEGADVTVNRWVYENGEVVIKDSYFTRYAPWRAVYEYGPGTDGIPKQDED